jgi:hypothetical protein
LIIHKSGHPVYTPSVCEFTNKDVDFSTKNDLVYTCTFIHI